MLSIARHSTFRGLVNINRRRNLFFNAKGPLEYTHNVLLKDTPERVYEVVSEVSKYQEFIPYCESSFVNKRDPVGRPSEAGLNVSFREYKERFVCDVNCQPNKKGYVVRFDSLSHNLFKELGGSWVITPSVRNKGQSTVHLVLRFEFHSILYNAVSSIFARSATSLVMEAFGRRVDALRTARDDIQITKQLE